jgi:preprotein translocase subunit SecA
MNFEIRKDVLKYDDVLDRQRKVIYDERRRVLDGADLHEEVLAMIADTVAGYVRAATAEGFSEDWDLDQLWTEMGQLYPVSLEIDAVEEEAGGPGGLSADYLIEQFRADALAAYDQRERDLGAEVLRELERRVVLSVLDRKWREHLYEMDYLREGIGLRAMAQRDPLVEYQREGYDMFAAMMESIKEEAVGFVFNIDVQVTDEPPEGAEVIQVDGPPPDAVAAELAASRAAASAEPAPATDGNRPQVQAKGLADAPRPARLSYSAPTDDGDVAVTADEVDDGTDFKGTARNAPCPCGSGKKYKRCHGDPKAVARMAS